MTIKRKMPSHARIYHHWRMKRQYARANKFTCFACGHEMRNGLNLDRAHIVPRCEGGKDDVDNIHLLCGVCHKLTEYYVPRQNYFEWMDAHWKADPPINTAMELAMARLTAPSLDPV